MTNQIDATISTGNETLDRDLGGGIPRGHIIEIYGTSSQYPSDVALRVIANAQENGDVVVFIDTKGAFNRKTAEAFGVDVEALLVAMPSQVDQVYGMLETFVRAKAGDTIVIDSVAKLSEEKLLGVLLNKYASLVYPLNLDKATKGVTLIAVNTRDKNGKTQGDNGALVFASSAQIFVDSMGKTTVTMSRPWSR